MKYYAIAGICAGIVLLCGVGIGVAAATYSVYEREELSRSYCAAGDSFAALGKKDKSESCYILAAGFSWDVFIAMHYNAPTIDHLLQSPREITSINGEPYTLATRIQKPRAEFTAANKYLKKSLAVCPDKIVIYTQLAMNALSIGDVSAAAAAIKNGMKTAETTKEKETLSFYSALLMKRQRHYDAAIERYTDLIESLPDGSALLPIIYYNIGCIYALQHNSEKAVQYLKQARNAGINDQTIHKNDTDFDAIRSDTAFIDFMKTL